VDCLFEEGKILLIGSSIDDWPTDDEASSVPTLLASYIDGSAASSAASEENKPSTSEKRAVDLAHAPWRKAPTYFHNRMIIKDFKR
jgi:hypothetical protein